MRDGSSPRAPHANGPSASAPSCPSALEPQQVPGALLVPDGPHRSRRPLYSPLLRSVSCPPPMVKTPSRWAGSREDPGNVPVLSCCRYRPTSVVFSLFGTSWRQVGTATLKWGDFIPVSLFWKSTSVGVFVAFRETLALLTNLCSARNETFFTAEPFVTATNRPALPKCHRGAASVETTLGSLKHTV